MMNIVGVGVDLIEVTRFQSAMARHGERLIVRLFTPGERAYCSCKRHPARHYAARFAAKEALFKALGTGWGSGVRWREAEVVIDQRGKPSMILHGKTKDLTERQGACRFFLSMAHTENHAISYVLLAHSGEANFHLTKSP